MPRIPTIPLEQNVAGPAGGRRASAQDFAAGLDTSIASQRAAGGADQAVAGAQARAGVATARGLGQLGGGLQSAGEAAIDLQDRLAQSDLSVKVATGQAELTSELEGTIRNAQPGDQTVVPRFLERFDKYFSKMGEGVRTRGAKEYLAKSVASLRGHLFVKATEAQADLAGRKLRNDADVRLSQLSTSAYNSPDAFNESIRQWNLTLGLLHQSGLSSAQVEEVKRSGERVIADSALRGRIAVDPKGTMQSIKSGEWKDFIDGGRADTLIKSAEAEIRQQEDEARRKKSEAREALREARDSNYDAAVRAWADKKLGWRGGEVDISKLNVTGPQREHLLNLLKVQENENLQLKNDPQVFMNFWEKFNKSDSDPKAPPVTEAEINAAVGLGLDVQHRNILMQRMAEDTKGDRVYLSAVYATARQKLVEVTDRLGRKDPNGPANYQRWLAWFKPQFEEGRQNKKSAAELLAEDSPLITGIDRFRTTPQDLLKRTLRSRAVEASASPSSPPPAAAKAPAILEAGADAGSAPGLPGAVREPGRAKGKAPEQVRYSAPPTAAAPPQPAEVPPPENRPKLPSRRGSMTGFVDDLGTSNLLAELQDKGMKVEIKPGLVAPTERAPAADGPVQRNPGETPEEFLARKKAAAK